ncbi:MAG TPA: hypothetical protein VHP11_18060 [Tepidisphaeraceae bacterium]|nr:hypothetical protein [Tepidisphaeraceae bacterium]
MRGWLDSAMGKNAAIALAIVGIGGMVWAIQRNFGRTDAAIAAQDRTFICAESGKAFQHRLSLSDSIPIASPYSGKRTGYPAELCYWTASGQIQTKPTPVLLNSYRGRAEPTFCPDCGRLVVSHNPAPDPSRQPPPTRSQYHVGSLIGREGRP